MRICIPTERDEGRATAVAGPLGSAPFLTLVDTVTGASENGAGSPPSGRVRH